MKKRLLSILAGFAIVAITAIAQQGPPPPSPPPGPPPGEVDPDCVYKQNKNCVFIVCGSSGNNYSITYSNHRYIYDYW